MTETFTPDNLIAGDFPIITDTATVVSGEKVVRGTLMGKITSGGKLKTCFSGNSDGSENPYAVMLEDVDASGGDVAGANILLTGELNSAALTFGSVDTYLTHKNAMRNLSMFVKVPVAA